MDQKFIVTVTVEVCLDTQSSTPKETLDRAVLKAARLIADGEGNYTVKRKLRLPTGCVA